MLSILVNDFASWRLQARDLILKHIAPDAIHWQESEAEQISLFDEPCIDFRADASLPTFKISRHYLELAQTVSHHRSKHKWDLLYLALWRMIQGETHLLQLSTDPLVYQLLQMQKSVSRDAHKMKAFVRFKKYSLEEREIYVAWHQPDHKIIKWVAPFFQRRFKVMQWLIITPDGSAAWDGNSLQFNASLTTLEQPISDDMDLLWRTYYRAIFNPARIKLKAMRKEMPVRHWPTLPETQIIPQLLQEAPQRVTQMLKQTEGLAQSAANFLPSELSLLSLQKAAKKCKACSLHQCATQTVFGKGQQQAKLMLVGEQPGEQEDIGGVPFIGPAGKLLNELLLETGLADDEIYLTNAVKHFKHQQQGTRRIHVSPHIREVMACKPWLEAEIAAVKPKLIVCLGLTAAKSLISAGFKIKTQRGQWQAFTANQAIMATYHPSAILRAVSEAQRQEIYHALLQDLQAAAKKLRSL